MSQEPLPEVFIAAVGQSADEVGDVVVLAEFLVGLWVQFGVLSFFGILAFERHLVLNRELVDLLRELLLISIRIIPTKPVKAIIITQSSYINSIFLSTCSRLSATL